jgi:8-oxo-dGTP pyrophosphatase MutT (NUDIX family)
MRRNARLQYAALPYAVRNGRLEVLLLTSRETRRWVIPKGWPEKKVKPAVLAAREAYEEAGLVGRVSHKPAGEYAYGKQMKSGKTVACTVDVFLFEVGQELNDWPEKGQREKCWTTPDDAAGLVQEPGLADLLLRLDVLLGRAP